MNREKTKILRVLSDGKPRHFNEIAKEAGLSKTVASYHLDELESIGVVKHDYETRIEANSVGKLISFYKLNEEKLKESLQAIQEILNYFQLH